MTTAGREIAFVRILWLLLAGAVYYYLVHRPIDHFWAFAAMLPFYIKIVYSGLKSSDARPGLDAAKGRMVGS